MKEYTFEDYRNIVEKHLMDFIPDVDHKSITLYESMKYSLSASGKLIRPVLLLATCDFLRRQYRRGSALCLRTGIHPQLLSDP